jgi:hypothetical protein
MSLVTNFLFFLWSDGVVWLFQISGITMGFNLVFEYGDIVIGIWFASFAVNLLPYASCFSHLVSLKKKIHHKRILLKFLCTIGFCRCPFILYSVYITRT